MKGTIKGHRRNDVGIRVDARGLSCPQPIILTRKKMKELGEGIFEIIVDTRAAKDNITRLAANEGWKIEAKEEGDDFILTLIR